MIFETLALPAFTGTRARSRFRVQGLEHLEDARSRGLGVLIATSHVGCWYLIPIFQAGAGFATDLVVREQEPVWYDRAFRRWHQRLGNHVYPQKGAAMSALRSLREKRCLFFHLDQNVHTPPRLFIPFLGRCASTSPTLGQLAARLGTPVVPAYCLPGDEGLFHITYEEPIWAPSDGDLASRSTAVTIAASRRIEEWIQRWPGAWTWGHDRWKDQPYFPGETEIGPTDPQPAPVRIER